LPGTHPPRCYHLRPDRPQRRCGQISKPRPGQAHTRRARRYRQWHAPAGWPKMPGAGEPDANLPYFYCELFELGFEAVGELDSRLVTVAVWKEPSRRACSTILMSASARGAPGEFLEHATQGARPAGPCRSIYASGPCGPAPGYTGIPPPAGPIRHAALFERTLV